MAKVVVIGGGVGGLACAARLAAAGHHVQLFEQASEVGGKLGTFERDGFRFDTGPSILTMPYVLHDLLDAIGLDRSAIPLRRLDPIARYRFGDGSWMEAAASDDAFLDEIERLRPGNADDMRRFLVRADAIWSATRQPFLESPLNGVRSLLRLSMRAADLRTVAPHRTLRQLADSTLRDERLVTFIDRYATYTGSDPRRAPAALASIPFVERHFGAWYVDGGLRVIADALAGRCAALDVQISVNQPVVKITRRNGRVDGVELASGGRVAADIVVANADAEHVYSELLRPGRRSNSVLRRLQQTTPSLSGFVLCLAVNGKTPAIAHHTVLFPDRYDDEFDDLFGPVPGAVRAPTIYCSVPSDDRVAPHGHESWFVLVNAPRHMPDDPSAGIDWRAPGFADRYGDRIVAQMAARGVDIRDRIRWRVVRTPADLADQTWSVGGSIYGSSSNGARAAFLRPTNRSPVAGLFLVGGSAHPGGGLPLVMLSAAITAGLIGRA